MMKKCFVDCYLHIGTEKTGTTTIQSFLARNRQSFAKEGVLYTMAGGEAGSQMGFATYAHAEPWTNDLGIYRNVHDAKDREAFRKRFTEQLEREFAEHPNCTTLVISSEHFHSRLKTIEEIAFLRDFLSRWVENFHIVVYLRRQDRVAVSFYSTKIKSGDPAPVLFPVAADASRLYYFDYEAVCNNWAAVFGDGTMVVRVFDRASFLEGDLLADFCAACGIRKARKSVPKNANESLDKAGADFLLELNRQQPRVVDRQFNPVQVRIAALISQMSRGRSRAGTAAEAQTFYTPYREGNERLKTRFLPNRTALLFDEDFSDYPEHEESMAPSYTDAVKLAIKLWRHKIQPDARLEEFDELAAVHRELTQAKAHNAFLQGQLAMKNANMQNAERSFRRALQLNGQHAGAHVMMARLALRAGETDRARKHLELARQCAKGTMPEIDRLFERLAGKAR